MAAAKVLVSECHDDNDRRSASRRWARGVLVCVGKSLALLEATLLTVHEAGSD